MQKKLLGVGIALAIAAIVFSPLVLDVPLRLSLALELAFVLIALMYIVPPVKSSLGDNLPRVALAVFVCALAVSGGFHLDPVGGMALLAPFMLGEIKMEDIEKAITQASKSVKETTDRMQQALDQAINDVKKIETITGKSNDELKVASDLAKKSQDELKKVMDRVLEVEQKIAAKHTGGGDKRATTQGQTVIGSEQFKQAAERYAKGGKPEMESVSVPTWRKAAILTGNVQTTGTVDILGEEQDVGLVTPATRQLIVRNLIPVYQTESNLIEFAQENVFTNNAGIQGQNSSPSGDRDGQLKNESAITFTLKQVPVVTIAHWIPASRQVLADAKMLSAYIDQRLRYGILFKEEDEVLNGANVEGDINGLINQATAFNRDATGDQMLDTLLKAYLQVTLSEFTPDGCVMSWIDWTNLLLVKDTQGRYVFGNPSEPMQSPRVWGRPVVPTNSMTARKFLVGAFQLATGLWDRETATVRIAEQHSDFFVRNMVAILAEERIALTVYRPTALVTGSFHDGGQPS